MGENQVRQIAIVGSGPAGYYTAEAALKLWGEGVRVDVFDSLPVPFGLIRSGVAPDHQAIKTVSRRYESIALTGSVRFLGNVRIGSDVTIPELESLYDAVILATGAPHDRKLGLPGEDLGNVFGSAAFVGWYNGHPNFAGIDPQMAQDTAVVIGNGNVALDVARILAKSPDEFAGSDIVEHALHALRQTKVQRIVVLGRRGPHQITMTPKELGELDHLARACPIVDPADFPEPGEDAALEPSLRKAVAHLRAFAARSPEDCAEKAVRIEFKFFTQPVALLGRDRVEAVRVEHTKLVDGQPVPSGETYDISAGLVISCIGYQTSPIPEVPFDEKAGRFANDEGRIRPGLYCVGWARRGPTGTIGANRPDGFAIVEKVADDIGAGAEKAGGDGFDTIAAARELKVVRFRDWKKIEDAEAANAREGSPREKFVLVQEMIAAAQG
jgi:adrenodoxin-NADP+ reductase